MAAARQQLTGQISFTSRWNRSSLVVTFRPKTNDAPVNLVNTVVGVARSRQREILIDKARGQSLEGLSRDGRSSLGNIREAPHGYTSRPLAGNSDRRARGYLVARRIPLRVGPGVLVNPKLRKVLAVEVAAERGVRPSILRKQAE